MEEKCPAFDLVLIYNNPTASQYYFIFQDKVEKNYDKRKEDQKRRDALNNTTK